MNIQEQLYEVVLAGRRFYLTDEWLSPIEKLVELASHDPDGLHAPVTLVKVGPKPIAVIKAIRNLLGLNLRECKQLTDKVRHRGESVQLGVFPWTLIPSIKANFEGIGARLEIPGALEMLAQEAE